MLIALFADIHGNREAFEACLADAEANGAGRYVFLGDYVGYGPDPAWVVDRVAAMAADGALVIKGNHDEAVYRERVALNPIARAAIAWTRGQLSAAQTSFLAELPLDFNEDDRLYVHASACQPETWIYTTGPKEAYDGFRSTAQRITFCGHTHRPALFNDSTTSLPHQHVPIPGTPMPLLAQRRWIAVLGAVGQPRDHDPSACYGLFDVATRRLSYERVPYDIDVTARKILDNGLPRALATRLQTGQ